jgi:ApaG protein
MEILTSNGITVSVITKYLYTHSNPRERRYVFAYQIRIDNGTGQTVQLLRRHWFIWDADIGHREVEGEGVVGLQPVLGPGESHTYASFCNLTCEVGKMHGKYLMIFRDTQVEFDAQIPEFKLVTPFRLN